MKPMVLEGTFITLHALAPSYIQPYLQSYSPCVQALLHVMSAAEEQRYLEQRLLSPTTFLYVIADKATLHVMGGIEIRDPVYRSQLYGWLNEHYWGKGYFQEAVQLVIDAYCTLTGHSTIVARVDCNNPRSAQALKKVGFAQRKTVPGPYGPQWELIYQK
jgi:RimJ/RimL family protein N-acetyltransferase